MKNICNSANGFLGKFWYQQLSEMMRMGKEKNKTLFCNTGLKKIEYTKPMNAGTKEMKHHKMDNFQ